MMMLSATTFLRYLSMAPGLILTFITGLLTYLNPKELGATSGYVAAVLITLLTSQKRLTLLVAALSLSFLFLPVFSAPGQADLQSRLFAGLMIIATAAYVMYETDIKTKASDYRFMMESIFAQGTQGIVLTDQSGKIVLINPYALRLYGFSEAEVNGSNIQLLIPGLETTPNPASAVPVHSRDLRTRKKDGSEFIANISSDSYEANGKTFHVYFVADVTLQKHIETTYTDNKKDLENLNKELESFSYSVSHDLKAPLRAIKGFAEIIREDYGHTMEQDAAELVQRIESNASRMSLLIEELLDLSKYGRSKMEKDIIDMNRFTRETIKELNQIIAHRAEIVVNTLHPVHADASYIKIVLNNLLSNAIKYSSKQEKPKIEINSKREHGATVYSVSDNGVGFDMRYAHKLFQAFQRLHLPAQFEGNGIGLATAQRIIHLHGGKIWAEAFTDKGATFFFSIPDPKPHPFSVLKNEASADTALQHHHELKVNTA